jgi:hypothetical protein
MKDNFSTVKSNLILISVAILIALLSMYLPLLSLFTLSVTLLIFKGGNGNSSVSLSIFFMAIFFALINILKMPESDLMNYIDYYRQLSNLDFYDAIDFAYLNIRPSEIIFRMYYWFFAQLSSPVYLIIFASTIIMYYTVIYFSLRISRFYIGNVILKNKYTLLMSIIWCSFVGITFSLTAHVVRQYLGFAVFLFGVLFLLNKRSFLGVVLIISAGFVHNSMFLFPILLLFSMVFHKYIVKKVVFIPAIIIAYILSNYLIMLQGSFPELINRGTLSEWSSVLIFIDISLLVVYGYLYQDFNRIIIVKYFNAFLILLILFLVLFNNESLVFKRYYYFFDIIRSALGVLIIGKLIQKFNKNSQLILMILSISISISVFILRFYKSTWDYGSYYISIMFIDYNDFLLRLDELKVY